MSDQDTMDDSILGDLTAVARAVPGVTDAAAVFRYRVRTAAKAVAAPTTTPATTSARSDLPPAELDGDALRVPTGAPVILQEALRQAALLAPTKGTIYVTRDGADTPVQTYPELLLAAQRVLAGLRFARLRPGDAVLFQFADNRAYLTAFWACVLGGFVPTPVAVATTYRTANEVNRKLHNAWRLLGRPVLVTDTATAPALVGVRELWAEPDVRVLSVAELEAHPPDTDWYLTTADSPVLNLLTSGSTGVPKCVQHTNASVAARTWAVAQARGYGPDDVSVIWMPLDHVTVAMYNVRDVFLRCQHVNAPIDLFLADPLRWLDWLDRYGATNTWAPNFAFAMVNERADDIGRRHWDLSRMREFTNAGEPVVAATSRRFLELLAPHGLAPDVMTPVWGMSETCSGVTYATQSRTDPAEGTVTVESSSLQGDLRIADPGTEDTVTFSTVGAPVPGVRVRVLDDDGAVAPADRIGELQIRGATMMRGYHANPDANRESFTEDAWFRTGDLAFVHDGALVIAGRKKDQIIVRGANYVAHELESVVERVDGVRVTFAAAGALREPGDGSDRLAVFFVPTTWEPADLAVIVGDIRAALVREAGLAPDVLVPVTEAEFPKTSSGKIQRAALVADLRAGRFTGRVARDEPRDHSLFVRTWSRMLVVDGSGAGGTHVVFADADVVPRLGLAGSVITVGQEQVDPGSAADVRRVLERVGAVDTVVFGWPIGPAARPDDPAARLATLTTEFTALVAALSDGLFGRPRLLVLTAGAVRVMPGDVIDLGVCALPGLVRTATAETSLPGVRQLDLPADDSEWPAAIAGELAEPGGNGVVAARQGGRWQPRLLPLPDDDATRADPVVAGGGYVVTGGLGGIAHDIASYLLATYGVRLMLLGRSPADGERATRLADLAELGDVGYRQVDVADEQALADAVTDAEQRWGRPIDGVLHLAGADPSGQWAELERHTLDRESPSVFAEQYRAKVTGTLAVAAVLADRPAASLVLFGSVNGEFGGHSFGAYSAANSFLVGFAEHWRHERGRDVRCLAWSMWTDVGMNRDRSPEPALRRGFLSLDGDEGLRLFLAASAVPDPYVLIGLDLANPLILAELAPTELAADEVLVAYTGTDVEHAVVHTALEPVLRACPVSVRLVRVPRLPTTVDGGVDTTQLLLDTEERTRLPARFSPPTTDLERQLAVIWSDVLDHPEVGRDDSFFDLGGNSLCAARLLARLDDVLAVRLATDTLYDNPTVAGLASVITDVTPG